MMASSTRRTGIEFRRWIAIVLALALLLTPAAPAATAQSSPPGVAVEPAPAGNLPPAGEPEPGVGPGPIVGGVALATTVAAGWPIHYDRQVPPAAIDTVAIALEQTLADVPRQTGLPPFTTPIAIYLLADQERFRLALAEIGRVRVELVADEVGGYTIERDGTMLTFAPYQALATDVDAVGGLAHELAHLAEREATARRPFPQWFNEGYASWIAERVTQERFPDRVEARRPFDRAIIASALHTRGGLLPWADLVTRTGFSRAGLAGDVGLAYAQSTLFVDWLARRHGAHALATFLETIGSGASPTAAFESTFGPFAPQLAEFEGSLAATRAELPPGLHPLTARPTAGRPVFLAMVGGAPNERVGVELRLDGEIVTRHELSLDPAGFGAFTLGGSETAPGAWLARVESPSLGRLEMSVVVDGPRQLSAPVQLPR